jgi:DNA adenine methylase
MSRRSESVVQPAASFSPPFRWAGSKRQLVPLLARYWRPKHTRYVEPFAGSACLFFALRPAQAVISDINPELIATYNAIKERPEGVGDALVTFGKGPDEYYRIRALDPSRLDSSHRAARFIYLNRFCFNGLYRTNLKGRFNVPYGGNKSGSLPQRRELVAYSQLFTGVTFMAQRFEDTLKDTQPGDLVYMDPPYRIAGTRIFREYDPANFTDKDLLLLRQCMDDMRDRRVEFVVSYAAGDGARILGDGYSSREVTVRRNISGFLASRRTISEVIITNVDGVYV